MNICFGNKLKVTLKDPPNAVMNFLKKEIGFLECESGGPGDIFVQFVNYLSHYGQIKYLSEDACSDDKGMYILDPVGKKCIFPLEQLDQEKCIIIAEHSISPPFFFNYILFPFLRMRLTKYSLSLIHSIMIFHKGKGIAVLGFKKSGKSSLLLKFLKEGAAYIADDFGILSGDGNIYAFPRPLCLQDYTLQNHVDLYKKMSLSTKARFFVKKMIHFTYNLFDSYVSDESLFHKVLFQLKVSSHFLSRTIVPLEQLFPNSSIRNVASLDTAFFIYRSSVSDIQVHNVSPREFAVSAAFASEFEFSRQMAFVDLFSSTFSREDMIQTRKRLIENEISIIQKGIERAKIYQVLFPVNISIDRLYSYLNERI